MRKFAKFEEIVLPTTMHAELVKLLAGRGIAEADLLAGTGVRPGMLGSPDARMSLLQAAIMADNALRLSRDPALGLDFGRHIHINGIGVVGLAVMSSKDLAEAIDRMLRYYDLLASNLRLDCTVRDGIMELSIRETIPLGDLLRFSTEVTVACLYALSEFVVGKPLPYVEIAFAYPEPAHVARYADVFACPVRFDAPVTQMRMQAAALAWPLPYASESTAKYADVQCRALLAEHASGTVAEQVRERLRPRIEAPPSLTQLARELQTSERSLRRALDELHTSYRALVDEVRKDRAIEMLTVTELSLDELGQRLGFATSRSFRRAFIRWTGRSPAALRRELATRGA